MTTRPLCFSVHSSLQTHAAGGKHQQCFSWFSVDSICDQSQWKKTRGGRVEGVGSRVRACIVLSADSKVQRGGIRLRGEDLGRAKWCLRMWGRIPKLFVLHFQLTLELLVSLHSRYDQSIIHFADKGSEKMQMFYTFKYNKNIFLFFSFIFFLPLFLPILWVIPDMEERQINFHFSDFRLLIYH